MMILPFRTRSILTAAAPMIILVPVISTPHPTGFFNTSVAFLFYFSDQGSFEQTTDEVMNTAMDKDSHIAALC